MEIVIPRKLHFPSGERDAEQQRPQDVPVHYLDLRGNNPRIYLFENLIRLLNSRKPKIVLLDNDPISKLAVQVGAWCKANKSHMFCISCENLPLGVWSTIRRRGLKSLPASIAKKWLMTKTTSVVSGIFAINLEGKKILSAAGYKHVVHMPLGFDPDLFKLNEGHRTDVRQKLGLHKPVIAYFGRLTPEKGIHILIQALEKLKAYDWSLMMDHFDSYASEYNQVIDRLLKRSGLQERVVYVNPSHSEIGRYMNAADVVVVPSLATSRWKEQYGRVAAEALACGCTVIASDSGALPELLNGHGLLFREGDIEQLSQVIGGILTGSGQYAAANKDKIAQYANEYLSIYKQREVLLSVFKPVLDN